MGTKGQFLHQVLQKNKLPFYRGIFAADTIPFEILKTPTFCIIINTDPHNMKGKHWIALIRHNQNAKIFDSLQFPNKILLPELQRILKILKATRIRKKRIQPILSDTCGFYCMHEILKFHLLLDYKTRKHINQLEDFASPEVNDKICRDNISKMIRLLKK